MNYRVEIRTLHNTVSNPCRDPMNPQNVPENMTMHRVECLLEINRSSE